MTPNYVSKSLYKSRSADHTGVKPKAIFNTANQKKVIKKKREFDPWHLSKQERTPTFVALTAPENRVMLVALLKRLKWKRVKSVTPQHILKHKFSDVYSKSVEAKSAWKKREEKSVWRKKYDKQENELENKYPAPAFPKEEFEGDEMLDLLWVGSHNPKNVFASSLPHFRVLFNAIDNISEMLNMKILRDQLLQIR